MDTDLKYINKILKDNWILHVKNNNCNCITNFKLTRCVYNECYDDYVKDCVTILTDNVNNIQPES